MEQLWILYALGGFLVLGIGDFIKKLVVSNGGNKEVFLISSFVLYIIVFGINVLIHGNYQFDTHLLQSALIIGILDFGISLGMLTSLKYFDTSTTFVSIRLITSFLILFIGIYLLGDVLNIYNIVGFVFGMIAIFLLSGFKISEKHTMNSKGIFAIIVTIISITLSNSYFKYVVGSINIDNFMFIKCIVSSLCMTLYMIGSKKTTHLNIASIRKVIPYVLISSVLSASFYLVFLPNIYLLGPLSLGYKILSYSLIVPIILSVIVLKEELDTTKLIAFFLTLVSIFLFLL